MLDDMDLERERGITIKSHAIQMEYVRDGEKYILNLIDTPGHVDFSYEVSRSIAACEGALLVVDATQGVQAQTISNLYMAIDHDLEIIPVVNKCDMPNAMPEEVEDEIIDLLGCKREEIIRASGKTGEGVEDILDAVVDRIPSPKGDENAPLQALIFDSVFNSFRGIIAYFKIVNGSIKAGDEVAFINTGKEYKADKNRASRLVPSHRLIARLGLSRFDAPAPMTDETVEPSEVRIMLSQHVGAPAQPVVQVGDQVTVGQMIGKIPEDALGAAVHASINGQVVEVTDKYIAIRR